MGVTPGKGYGSRRLQAIVSCIVSRLNAQCSPCFTVIGSNGIVSMPIYAFDSMLL